MFSLALIPPNLIREWLFHFTYGENYYLGNNEVLEALSHLSVLSNAIKIPVVHYENDYQH